MKCRFYQKYSNLEMKKVSGTNCDLFYNSIFAILVINSTGLSLIGGNITNNIIAKLPLNVKTRIVSMESSSMNNAWVPTTNNIRINCTGSEYGENITARSVISINDATIYEEIFLKRNSFEVK